MGLRVMVCRFPFGLMEHSDTVDWLCDALPELERHPQVDQVFRARIADTPVDMSRNRAMKSAIENNIDFLVMVDSDMAPDLLVGNPHYPEAVPFLPAALDFAIAHDGPCVVAAPYCSGPPDEAVLVMRWAAPANDQADLNVRLTNIPREEASCLRGIQEVAALPTGLMLIDMQVARLLPAPWFHYEWKDAERTAKASTEDIVFSRNLHMLGVPQYCAWDSWAGHHKTKLVGKPRPIAREVVPTAFRKAVLREAGHAVD